MKILVFPIRGKIPNAFRTPKNKFMDNAEVQGITKIILGTTYRSNFDPIKDVEWEKIIFMADADIDGSHISALLLRFFIIYMPQLIKAGKVYKAVPPLYGLPKGGKKGGIEYFTHQYDFVKYIQKDFIKNNVIAHKNNKPLSNKELLDLFMLNEDYVYELERLSNTFAVAPELMEMVLYGYIEKKSFEQMKKEVKERFRFMEATKIKDTVKYDGIIGKSNTLFMNDKLITEAQDILSIILSNKEKYYVFNGKRVNIYDIMKSFEDAQPNGLYRYKGLGEMDAKQLAESTLDINNRTLIRYTLEDAKAEINAIREYESDLSKLFKYTVKRQDLID